MTEDTWQDCGVCVKRARTAAKVWTPNEKYQVLTKVPLQGVYLHLGSRGSVAIWRTQRDFIHITLGLEGNSCIQTTSNSFAL
jgi:hypothetical protein